MLWKIYNQSINQSVYLQKYVKVCKTNYDMESYKCISVYKKRNVWVKNGQDIYKITKTSGESNSQTIFCH